MHDIIYAHTLNMPILESYKKRRFYTWVQMLILSLIGGPFGAVHALSHNFHYLKKEQYAMRTWIVGAVIISVSFIALLIFFARRAHEGYLGTSSPLFMPLLYTGVVLLLAFRFQDELIMKKGEKYVQEDRHGIMHALAMAALIFLGTFTVFFLLSFVVFALVPSL